MEIMKIARNAHFILGRLRNWVKVAALDYGAQDEHLSVHGKKSLLDTERWRSWRRRYDNQGIEV